MIGEDRRPEREPRFQRRGHYTRALRRRYELVGRSPVRADRGTFSPADLDALTRLHVMGAPMSGTDEQPHQETPAPAPEPAPWPVPPEGGYTVDDLYRLASLPSHTELIDGSLVFRSPQTIFHRRTVSLLERRLDDLAPSEFWVEREMTTVLNQQNAPEPDVMVVRAEAVTGLDQTRFEPEDVVLAIEVVSPDSRSRDRETKPMKYAKAGIPHLWRVEKNEDQAVAYVFELEPATGTYTPTGIFHDRLKVSVPFPIDIDLGEISLP
jgi:Uma2 family endonuclease